MSTQTDLAAVREQARALRDRKRQAKQGLALWSHEDEDRLTALYNQAEDLLIQVRDEIALEPTVRKMHYRAPKEPT